MGLLLDYYEALLDYFWSACGLLEILLECFWTTFGLPIKHLLIFLTPNIIFIGEVEKDIRCVSRVQYLSQLTNKCDIRLKEDQ